MTKPFSLGLFGAVALAAAACEQADPSASNSKIEALSSQVSALRTELEQAKTREGILQSRVQVAEATIRTNAPRSVVEFDPTVSAYQRVDSDLGMFAVAISDVKQFADGVRVTIKLGNLSSITYRGAKLFLEYGPRAPDLTTQRGTDATSAWLEALQVREEGITTYLQPGAWNPVQVTLPKLDAKNFGYLSVRIEANVIALR